MKKQLRISNQTLISHKRGAILTTVLLMAISAAIVVYGFLIMVTSFAQEGAIFARRAKARYAAEAGVVWAMQQMQTNSTWSDPAGDLPWDLPDTVMDFNVDVFVPPCVFTPCETRQITANVTYN